jgi:HK97 gp10 family phage protein
MPDFASLESLANHFSELSEQMNKQNVENAERAAKMVADKARSVIGSYEFGWPQLAPATIADRIAKGFSPNDPLLRTGELRDSIEYVVEVEDGGEKVTAEVGSNDPVAEFQELGTSTIPPRSFLWESLMRCLPEIEEMAGDQAVEVFRSGRAAPVIKHS